jgi:hypothetical protein
MKDQRLVAETVMVNTGKAKEPALGNDGTWDCETRDKKMRRSMNQ